MFTGTILRPIPITIRVEREDPEVPSSPAVLSPRVRASAADQVGYALLSCRLSVSSYEYKERLRYLTVLGDCFISYLCSVRSVPRRGACLPRCLSSTAAAEFVRLHIRLGHCDLSVYVAVRFSARPQRAVRVYCCCRIRTGTYTLRSL